jgi:tRNA pseudouridine(38-40) synthase
MGGNRKCWNKKRNGPSGGKAGGKPWVKKETPEDSANAGSGDSDNDGMERHKGSYPIEDLQKTEEYKNRVDIVGLKRKFAICFSYLGSQYQGLQINPDCKSVEAEVEKALFLAGSFQELNYGNLHKLQWTRAARTDRGVHAIGQCCAARLTVSAEASGREDLINHVNRLLPLDIRVLGLTKVTKSFNSKLSCSKRRYHYLLPTYMLADSKTTSELLSGILAQQGPMRDCARAGGFAEAGSTAFLNPVSLARAREELMGFRVSADRLSLLRAALQRFVGTRSYHNYTTKKQPNENSAKRYMLSFTASEPMVAPQGTEWVLLSVEGQSFLLNQIRKMVGMATEVARGSASLETLDKTFTSSRMEIPMAPGLGLYLDELFYEQYNRKQADELERQRNIACGKAKQKRREELGNPRARGDRQIDAAKAAVAAANAAVEGQVYEGGAGDAAEVAMGDEDLAIEDRDEQESKRRKVDGDGKESVADLQAKMAAPTVVVSSTVPPITPETVELEQGVGEPIDWHSNPVTQSRMQRFRDEVVWPHIYEEEGKGLQFMYYMDFVRVNAFDYVTMDFNKGGYQISREKDA